MHFICISILVLFFFFHLSFILMLLLSTEFLLCMKCAIEINLPCFLCIYVYVYTYVCVCKVSNTLESTMRINNEKSANVFKMVIAELASLGLNVSLV